MASPQERVAELARSQVGYVPPQGKWNKYAEALDRTDLYNYAKNGYDWCDIFYDWLLVEEFGVELAKAMTNQPTKGCGVGCDGMAQCSRVRLRRGGRRAYLRTTMVVQRSLTRLLCLTSVDAAVIRRLVCLRVSNLQCELMTAGGNWS